MARKRNRFSTCYGLFTVLAIKTMGLEGKQTSGMRLAVMIIKEKMKKEFGIKSMAKLDKKELKKFEHFLSLKL